MDWLWAAVAGFVAGAVLAPFVEPWTRRLQRLGRRVAGEPVLDVHVERDQAVIWAGWPPWLSFAYFFPGSLPDEPPPDSGFDWSAWADRHGGYDFMWTMLRVTLVPRSDVTVVVETPVVSQRIVEVPPGVGALYPAPGGADINPRRYQIDLDFGLRAYAQFQDESQPAPAPSWSLGKGEAEQLTIWARARDDKMHEWVIDLPILVDGQRRMVRVDKDGDPFVTVGEKQPHEFLARQGDQWESWTDWQRSIAQSVGEDVDSDG